MADLLTSRSFKKNDNSHGRLKVALRVAAVDALGKNRLKVLDAYHGSGWLWSQVKRLRPKVEFDLTKVEKKKSDRTDVIVGDNLKVLPTLPLDEYDLIDLDAYGVPNRQLSIVAERAPNVPVFVTAISSSMGPTPHQMLEAVGIPAEWEKDVVIVFKRLGFTYLWDGFCAGLGYTTRIGHTVRDSIGVKRYDLLLSDNAPAPLQRSGAWPHLQRR